MNSGERELLEQGGGYKGRQERDKETNKGSGDNPVTGRIIYDVPDHDVG